MGKILLYYKYVSIENPESVVLWQKELCQSLGLTGRIIVAQEGINGTLGGEDKAIENYKSQMINHHQFGHLFNDIDFKESSGSSNHFPRLRIVLKNEIVRLGLDPQEITAEDGGIHLTPEEVHNLIAQKPEDLVLLDTRNDYESRIGTFKDAIIPNTKTFREFPQYIDQNLEQFKDKKVLMFCTGGVRCERASAYLKSKNISKEVYQIKGGIHRYVEKYQDGFFRGKNYVFDGRIAAKVTNDILSQCTHCNKSYDDYTNCINAECNIQIIVCPECISIYHNTCSQKCLDLVNNKKVNVRTIDRKTT
ncbi:rhodanese-related sulfurtransferase [Candidatus Babela massiliensis]|uniref:tRNA uridine(34) hydroxylase n=1 Tax=Candidatus Babela massiliensis TaxID=673862 RepID=V6DKA2_9BACT|nr:rhodanese-related sulfurtransferase [Candidatus Babela massiliensis]CDK30956.1 Rhodanese-related sulfurtransferase [Candidatus Babela massiliensis]